MKERRPSGPLFRWMGIAAVLGAVFTYASVGYFSAIGPATGDALPYALGSGAAVVLFVLFALAAPPNDQPPLDDPRSNDGEAL
jgi:hypothetical protein